MKDGKDFYAEPVRQLLRRQLLPDLRHQLHGAGDHGADRGEQVGRRRAAAHVGCRRAGRSPGRCRTGPSVARERQRRSRARVRLAASFANTPACRRKTVMSLFAMEGISKRYGGVRALEEARSRDRGRPHPRRARRERRRQVDADQDHGRRRRARRGPHAARRPARSRSPSPAAANAAGIVCIFQELSLIPDLSVADNICDQQPAAPLRPDRPRGAAPHRRGGAGARRRGRTSTRSRWSRTCRCRAARWSRSPRRWRASRAS